MPLFDLVITCALRQELPIDVLRQQFGFEVWTLAHCRAGAWRQSVGKAGRSGVLIFITGVGAEASKEAAALIATHIQPRYVLNIGTCGVRSSTFPIGTLFRVSRLCDPDGNYLDLIDSNPLASTDVRGAVEGYLQSVLAPIHSEDAWLDGVAGVDMEAYWQAKQFSTTTTSFHCLKWVSDLVSSSSATDFDRNLSAIRDQILHIFTQACGGDMTAISVIIPVHNRPEKVDLAIRSVLSQRVRPLEVIVVDDGSTPALALASDLTQSVRLCRLDRCEGVSAARNRGADLATGDWLAFLDSDDEWRPDKLGNQMAFLKDHPFYALLQSEEIWIRNGRRVNSHKHHQKKGGWIWDAGLHQCMISPSSVMIRRDVFMAEQGFDEQLRACEDYDLWLRLCRFLPVGLEASLSLIKTGGHSDQLSRAFPAMDRFRIYALLKQALLEEDPGRRKVVQEVIRTKAEIVLAGAQKRGVASRYDGLQRLSEAIDTDPEDWVSRVSLADVEDMLD